MASCANNAIRLLVIYSPICNAVTPFNNRTVLINRQAGILHLPCTLPNSTCTLDCYDVVRPHADALCGLTDLLDLLLLYRICKKPIELQYKGHNS